MGIAMAYITVGVFSIDDLIVGYIWEDSVLADDCNYFGYYDRFTDVFSASAIHLWEMALSTWYALFIHTGWINITTYKEIGCHISVWGLSLVLSLIGIAICSAKDDNIIYGIMYTVVVLDIIHYLFIIIVNAFTINRLCNVRSSSLQDEEKSYLRAIVGYPIIYVLLYGVYDVMSILTWVLSEDTIAYQTVFNANIYVTSFVLPLGGIFNTVYFVYTRKICCNNSDYVEVTEELTSK